jgi:hypothetical protein
LSVLLKVIVLGAAVCATSARSYEVREVCAKYLGTGKAYHVEANILDGSELNDRVGGYRFSSFSKYVVIFWADDQASVIELDYSFGPSPVGTEGTDQEGYRWSVSDSSICF